MKKLASASLIAGTLVAGGCTPTAFLAGNQTIGTSAPVTSSAPVTNSVSPAVPPDETAAPNRQTTASLPVVRLASFDGDDNQDASVRQPEPELVRSQSESPAWMHAPISANDAELNTGVIHLVSPNLMFTPEPIEDVIAEMAGDHSSEISVDEAIAMAMSGHPAIDAINAKIRGLQGERLQAGLAPNPALQYNGDEIGNEDSGGLHSLALTQTHVTANKLYRSRAVVSAKIAAAQAELEVTRQRVITDVRSAFTSAVVAQRRLAIVGQLREVAGRTLRSVEVMVNAEEVSRIALLQAQTELQEAELAVENADVLLTAARGGLRAVVGNGDFEGVLFRGDLDAMTAEIDLDTIRQDLQHTSPQIAQRIAQIDQARRALTLACAQATPNFSTQVGVGYDTATDDTFAALQLSVPLPIRNRNQGNVHAARAAITAADAQLRRTELRLDQQLATTYGVFQAARQRSQRIGTAIIPRSQETLALSQEAFEAGESSYLQLLTVQRSLFRSRLRQLEATAEAAVAAAKINGYLLTGSLTN